MDGEALADLNDVLDHTKQDSPQPAVAIAARVETTVGYTVLFPFAARYQSDHDVYDRFVPKTRLVMIYRVSDDAITVIGVLHTSRCPD